MGVGALRNCWGYLKCIKNVQYMTKFSNNLQFKGHCKLSNRTVKTV